MIDLLNLNFVVITLGSKCNFNCIYCDHEYKMKDKINADNNKIDEKVLKYVKNRLKPNTRNVIVIYGGEPLLYWDEIVQIVEYMGRREEYNLCYYMCSNGSLLTPEMVKYCNENSIIISISQDGVHNNITRKVNIFDNEKVMSYYDEMNIKAISPVISSYNSDLIELANYYKTIPIFNNNKGYKMFMPFICRPCINGKEELYDFDFDLVRKSIHYIFNYPFDYDNFENNQNFYFFYFLYRLKGFAGLVYNNPSVNALLEYTPNCTAPIRRNMDIYGNLYYCMYGMDYKLGTIDDSDEKIDQVYKSLIEPVNIDENDTEDIIFEKCLNRMCKNSNTGIGSKQHGQYYKIIYEESLQYISKLKNRKNFMKLQKLTFWGFVSYICDRFRNNG